jgi:hypothetical protein
MPGERSAFHLWTPPSWQEKTSGVGRAQSDAAICPACDAALSRRLPVWEFAGLVHLTQSVLEAGGSRKGKRLRARETAGPTEPPTYDR